MRTFHFFCLACAVFLFSCSQSKYATVGAYESDDAYFSSDDNYISDFALVDDEAAMNASSDSSVSFSDDYYDPNYVAPQTFSPNNNNSLWNPDPWGCGPGFCNGGFGAYQYGSFWNPYQPTMGLGWSPFSGYYTSFGMNYGFNPYMNGWNSWSYNPWYTPYYSPYYFNSWAYNPWYSPFNYSPMGWNSFGWPVSGNEFTVGNIVQGARNPISSMGSNNSAYSSNLFYSGLKKNEVHSYVETLNDDSRNTSRTKPSKLPSHESVSSVAKPSVVRSNTQGVFNRAPVVRESDRATKPQRTTSRPVKPGFHNAPVRTTSPGRTTPNRELNPSNGRNVAPGRIPSDRGRTAPDRSSPRRDAPSSPGRDFSPPTRSSSPSSSPSAPSRSGGGGSNSPRRK